jgi:hypothetical protein
MKNFQDFLALNLLAGAVLLYATCGPAAGQIGQRGMSSRGVNAVGSRNTMLRRAAPPVTTGPLNNGAIYGGNAGGSGPLNFGYIPFFAGPGFYVDPSTANLGGGEMSSPGELGPPSALPSSGSRPSIRPRLNISDPEAMNRTGVLPSIRDTILEQLAQVAERPFTAPWYAAHPSVVPVSVEGDNAWRTCNWTEASQWLGMDAEPQRYDYRPDKNGLILVYRNEAREGRAVDARKPAVQLAGSSEPVADEPPGLSLGIFAAVPPVDEPVQILWHLVLGKSGVVSGNQYDLATDSMQPVGGALDPATQRTAWKAGTAVVETGLKNLTEDVARALVFREDGWTQPWILMRIPEPAELPPQQGQQ